MPNCRRGRPTLRERLADVEAEYAAAKDARGSARDVAGRLRRRLTRLRARARARTIVPAAEVLVSALERAGRPIALREARSIGARVGLAAGTLERSLSRDARFERVRRGWYADASWSTEQKVIPSELLPVITELGKAEAAVTQWRAAPRLPDGRPSDVAKRAAQVARARLDSFSEAVVAAQASEPSERVHVFMPHLPDKESLDADAGLEPDESTDAPR
jgi:hypothetical protein